MGQCTECEKIHENERTIQRNAIKDQLAKKYADTDSITVAIVETKNGFLSWRPIGDESLGRLKVLEYLYLMQGIAAE